MANADPALAVASAARTTSGNSGILTLADKGLNLAVLLDVTAASGTTPTLDISIEWSQDGGTTFAAAEPADSFTQITAAKKVSKKFDIKGTHCRIVWTIAGTTPSFTFSARTYVTD